MTRGPYTPEPGHDAPAGSYVGFRQWVALPCLQNRHDRCHDLRRCDCQCHSMTTGALLLHMEPA